MKILPSILVLFVVLGSVSVVSALSNAVQTQACSSLNSVSVGQGPKAIALRECARALQKESSTNYSFRSKGKFISIDLDSDPLGCGFPSRYLSLEIGSLIHTDSAGTDYRQSYVFAWFDDYDCSGNWITGGYAYVDTVPTSNIKIDPFSDASLKLDTDVNFSDGLTRHLTVDLVAAGFGFVNNDKFKYTSKRETSTSKSVSASKSSEVTLTGNINFDSSDYTISSGWMYTHKSEFEFKEL